MQCDISGKVNFVEDKVTKDGQKYIVVKVVQEDKKGNVETVPVRIFDDELAATVKVGGDIIITDVKVTAYKSGADRVALSVDKW